MNFCNYSEISRDRYRFEFFFLLLLFSSFLSFLSTIMIMQLHFYRIEYYPFYEIIIKYRRRRYI